MSGALMSWGAGSYELQTFGSLHTQAGSGDFAPFYQASNCDGIAGVSPYAAYLTAGVRRAMTDTTCFSYGFGAEVATGFISTMDYDRYVAGVDGSHARWTKSHPNPGYMQLPQLYGEVRLHSLFLLAGIKPYNRSLFDSPSGSGDFVLSRNAAPMPQVRIGLSDFTDVPFTQGWLQVQAELSYGWLDSGGWVRRQFNHYLGFVTTDVKMHHKRVYFRIAPQRPLTFTFGMQHAAQFGGRQTSYVNGEVVSRLEKPGGVKEAFKMFIPRPGDNFYPGNHLGSWDFELRYRFGNGSRLTAYCQHPWEDGSGIGMLNGWDGIYGLRYNAADRGVLTEAVVEYLDFTNQSGPLHWSPGDNPGTPITSQATGADNYYNNYFYNGWAYRGMALGNPFFKSPAYNLDGYSCYTDNRLRGFHIGLTGHLAERWSYSLKGSWRTSWGTPLLPAAEKRHDTSLFAGVSWLAPEVEGLTVHASAAWDNGNLYGDNFGVNIALTYQGDFAFGKKKNK